MNPETYTLRKGTILYRGDTPFYLRTKNIQVGSIQLEPHNRPTFFALSHDDVAQYGIIYGWEVPNDIELPLIDNPDIIKKMYAEANNRPDVQKVMRENYGFNPESGEIGDRNSIFEKDVIFYTYLCENGYSGYASNDLEDGQRFSYEIMICNTSGYVCKGIFYPSEVGDKDLYISNQIQKYQDRIKPKETKRKNKSKDLSPVKGSDLFGSPVKTPSMFESPVKGSNLFESPVKGSNLFGSPGTRDESFKKRKTLKGGKSKKNRKTYTIRRYRRR